MAFTLAKKTDSFYFPIQMPVVSESGTVQSYRFEFKFKRVSRSKLNALQKAQEAQNDYEVDTLERDVDWIMEVTDGWRNIVDETGQEVPFTRDTLRALLDNVPNAAGVIVKAFFDATLGGGKRGN